MHPFDITSSESLRRYLYSPQIIRLISTERASPSSLELKLLDEEQKGALIELLSCISKPIYESEHYLRFVKNGWLNLDDNDCVLFPCQFSKEIIYLHFYNWNPLQLIILTTLKSLC